MAEWISFLLHAVFFWSRLQKPSSICLLWCGSMVRSTNLCGLFKDAYAHLFHLHLVLKLEQLLLSGKISLTSGWGWRANPLLSREAGTQIIRLRRSRPWPYLIIKASVWQNKFTSFYNLKHWFDCFLLRRLFFNLFTQLIHTLFKHVK